jgi:hypothetical protein
VIFAAARRFLGLVGALSVATAAIAALVAVLTENSLVRSVSIGFYAVGSFLTVTGFAVGTRPAFRPGRMPPGGNHAAVEERASRATASLLIVLGLLLLVLGVAVDARVRLI